MSADGSAGTAVPMDRTHRYIPLTEMRRLVGEETGVSDWVEIGQDRIDAFADLSGDHQFIHVDPDAAADGEFGTTIAHGFYTLSLLSYLAIGARPRLRGLTRSVNYGLDKVRFVAPVASGARVRGRFTLAKLIEDQPGEVTQHWDAIVEIEGQEIASGGKPALAARWLTRAYLENI